MSSKRKDYFIFFAGLIGTFSLRILGTFYLIEILAFVSYLFIPWRRYARNPRMVKLLKFAFLWLLGAIFADLWNHTGQTEMLKGWFNIIFFIGLLPFVYWALEDNPKRWIWYVAGNGISSLLSFYTVRGENFADRAYEIWQLYAWGPFVIGCASVLYYRGKHKLAMLTYLGWAFYSLYGGSRNMFLNISLAVCIMYMVDKFKERSLGEKIVRFKSKLIPVFVGLLIGALCVDTIYENLASTGALGDYAYEKYMQQKYSSGNMLQNGRAETFLGLEIVMQNPIIGYGSFATYKSGMFDSGDITNKLNSYYDGVDVEYLPSHSHVVGYWLYHGILGGLFWMYILFLMWKLFKSGAFMYEPKLIGHCLYFTVAVLWAICFSPFGQRAPMAFYIAYLIVIESYYVNDKYKLFSIKK